MNEEDERPPNGKSHAYHFSISNKECVFCLLTPPAILEALPGVLGIRGTRPFILREQGNKCHFFRGTGEQAVKFGELGNTKFCVQMI